MAHQTFREAGTLSQFIEVEERRDKILRLVRRLLRRRIKRIPVWVILLSLITVPTATALIAVTITNVFTSSFQSRSSPVVANLGSTQPTLSACQTGGYTYLSGGITLNWSGTFVAGTIIKQYLCLQNVGTGDEIVGLSGGPPACTVNSNCSYGTMTSPQANQAVAEPGCVVSPSPATALTVQPSKFAVIELDWCIPANAPVGSTVPSFPVLLS